MSDLQEAIALIKAGDRQGGQRMLAAILAGDPTNETAWLWMSGVVEQDEQRAYCLKQILKWNPDHSVAREALACLQEPPPEHGVPPSVDDLTEFKSAAVEGEERPPETVRDGLGIHGSGGGAPVEQAPALAGRDPAMLKDMADFVVAQLSKHESVDNIVLKLCEVSNMSWSEAQAFVESVEEERRQEVVSRRRPVLLLVGAVTLLLGAYLTYNSATYLASFFAVAGEFTENPVMYILGTPALLRRFAALAVGTAILVGGLWGTVRALLPPRDKTTLVSDLEGAGGEGIRSIDDVVGVGIRVGGRTVASSRQKRR